jgi:hypothetical protein
VPTVTSLTPNAGPYSGGTTVIIKGTNLASVSEVHFGSYVVTDILVIRPTAIQVTSPVISPAVTTTVDVRVVILNGITALNPSDKFTFTITCIKATVGASPTSPQAIGIPITFTAVPIGCPNPTFVFWLQYPDKHWVMARNWQPSAQWTWPTTGLPAGLYTVHVGANQAGYPQTSFQALGSISFTLSGCTNASLAPDNPSPQVVGTQITFTASANCLGPRFEFWLGYPNGTWVMKQPFLAENTWAWDTTGYSPGTYKIHVWANRAGDPTKTFESFKEYIFILTGCTAVSLTPPTSAQAAGAPITFTATPVGCTTALFEFWVGYPNGSWVMQQSFRLSNMFSWKTAGLAPGIYSIHVWANQQGGSLATWQANGGATVALAICTSATISPTNPTAPAGTDVPLSATSTDCVNPRYAYWVRYPNGTWYPARGFGDAAFTWSTTGLAPGTYEFHVWANNFGDSQKTWEANGAATVTLTGCTSVTLSPNPVAQPAGAPIDFAATPAGCTTPLYEFWVGYPNGTWAMQRSFDPSATFSFRTAGLAPGRYLIHVWANTQGASQARWQANGEAPVALNICTSASITPVNPSAPAGSSVPLTAGSTDCASPLFEFWVGYPNGTWVMQQSFRLTNTFSWNTAGLAPGTYLIHVWANNSGDSQRTWEANGSDTVTLTGCTSATVGSSVAGTSVTFTATADTTGCPDPVYEFWLQYPDKTWHMMQSFTPGSATWVWHTTGFPKGNYALHVWANNRGSNYSTFETFAPGTFTLT